MGRAGGLPPGLSLFHPPLCKMVPELTRAEAVCKQARLGVGPTKRLHIEVGPARVIKFSTTSLQSNFRSSGCQCPRA
jgi:hypothetical protein